MKKGFDIYNCPGRLKQAEGYLMRSRLPDESKQLLLKFENYLLVSGLCAARVAKYLCILTIEGICLGKDFDKAVREDVERVIADLNKRDLAEWTKHDHKLAIKRFYKWLLCKDAQDYPDIVRWISLAIPQHAKKLPSSESMLNEEDILKLVDAAGNLRDKAFVYSLWESGARVSELASLQLKNMEFDDYGLLITVEGKTGMRKIRLVNSTPLLANWISAHPFKHDRESPLWINIASGKWKGLMITYKAIAEMLKNLASRVDIKKRFNPHSFRHARATFLANHLTEFQMNQYFGWTQGSDMPRTYVHLSGKNTDDSILNLYGLKKKDKEEKPEAKRCPRCSTITTPKSEFCNRCGAILDEKTAMRIDEERKQRDLKRQLADKLIQRLFEKGVMNELLEKELKTLAMQPPLA